MTSTAVKLGEDTDRPDSPLRPEGGDLIDPATNAVDVSETVLVVEAIDFVRLMTEEVLARLGVESGVDTPGIRQIASAVRRAIGENYIVKRDEDDQIVGTVSLPTYAIEEGYIPYGIEEAKVVISELLEQMVRGSGPVDDAILLLAASLGMLGKLNTKELFFLMHRSNSQRAEITNIPSEVEVRIREILLTHDLTDRDLFHTLLSMCIHSDQEENPAKSFPYKQRMYLTFKDYPDPDSLGLKPGKFAEFMFKSGHDYYKYSEMLDIDTDRDEIKAAFYTRATKNPDLKLKNVAIAHYNLIRIHKRMGQFEEALASARTVLGIYERGEVIVPDNYKRQLKRIIDNLAKYLRTAAGHTRTSSEA